MLNTFVNSSRRRLALPLLLTGGAAIFFVGACGVPALAGPIFEVHATAGGNFVRNVRVEKRDDEPVSAEAVGHPSSGPSEQVLNFGRAATERSLLRGITLKGNSHSLHGGATTVSRVTIDDLVFSGPADEVRFFPQVHLDVFLRAANFQGAGASADFRIEYELFGRARGKVYEHDARAQIRLNNGYWAGEQGLFRFGAWNGFPDIFDTITERVTPGGPANTTFVRFSGTTTAIPSSGPVGELSALMPTGEPVSLTLRLGTGANVSTNPGVVARADANFGDTFGLPTSGPIFDLPPGFTANSEQAGIVNNRFVGAQTAIPEPSSLALLGLGAVGILGCNRRRKRHGNAERGGDPKLIA